MGIPGSVRAKPGDLVDIDYLYDIGGESIFAPDIAQEEDLIASLYSGFAEGGIVQNSDIEQLIRYLKGSGN